ncbi:hypothetical protein [Dongia sp.]|uniref:hypothetical protein n=1 Tax=Dongia sp. TaxID=1977262 RepID=UPI0035B2BAE3
MTRKALKKLIREAEQAAVEAEQTALRRARHGARVQQSARGKENFLKYRIAGNAICYARGDISLAEFHLLLAEDCAELPKIDAAMIDAGLRKRRNETVPVDTDNPQASSQSTYALTAAPSEMESIELAFAQIPQGICA